MARLSRQPDSATAQFFINVNDNSGLDSPMDGAGYAVFGRVVEGMDVADTIVKVDKRRHPAFPGSPNAEVPKEAVVIQDVQVVEPLDVEAAKAQINSGGAASAPKPPAMNVNEVMISASGVEDYLTKLDEKFQKKAEVTGSGLGFLTIKPNAAGAAPTNANVVTVSYVGRLLDGKEIDRARNVELRLANDWPNLQGLKEGLLKMKKGETAILVVPPELGWGAKGVSNKVPPNTPLVFEVELKDVK
jgi:FKBP-type peptidyl-prolyl cis-trans isomerase